MDISLNRHFIAEASYLRDVANDEVLSYSDKRAKEPYNLCKERPAIYLSVTVSDLNLIALLSYFRLYYEHIVIDKDYNLHVRAVQKRLTSTIVTYLLTKVAIGQTA